MSFVPRVLLVIQQRGNGQTSKPRSAIEEIQFDQYRNTRHFAASRAYQFSGGSCCAACGENVVDDKNTCIGFASEGVGMDAQGIAAVLEIKAMLDGVYRQLARFAYQCDSSTELISEWCRQNKTGHCQIYCCGH